MTVLVPLPEGNPPLDFAAMTRCVGLCGDRVAGPDEFADAGIGWGLPGLQAVQTRCARACCIDLGYLGNRLEWLGVAVGGLNGAGAPPCPVDPRAADRWEWKLRPPRQPWAEHRRVLVFAQVPQDHSLAAFGHDPEARAAAYARWLRGLCAGYAAQGREVAVLEHPKAPGPLFAGIEGAPGFVRWAQPEDKPALMEWAEIAVAFNSNALVEAFLEGLPVVPCHPGSLCWSVRSAPDDEARVSEAARLAWLARVASRQFLRADLESGGAWRVIRRGMCGA